jgi:hypothetical protein
MHRPGAEYVLDLGFELRESFLAPLRHPANAVDSDHGSAGAVHHAPRMEEFLDEFDLSLVEHLVEVSPHHPSLRGQLISRRFHLYGRCLLPNL